MTVWYSNELAGIDSVPAVKANASAAYNAKVLRFRATVPLAAQQIGDTINLARFPAGATFMLGILNSSVTLSTSTIAVGVAGTTGKYLTAQTFTTPNVPVLFATDTEPDEALAPYTAEEDVILTVAALALPASGQLVVDFLVSNV